MKGSVSRASTTEGKDDVHLGLHLYRLAVEQIGLVTPGFHSFDGSLLQHGRAADNFQILNRTFLGNHGLQNNRSLDAGSLSNGWIARIDPADSVTCDHARGNSDSLWRCSFDGWAAGAHSAKNAAHHAIRAAAAHTFHARNTRHGWRRRSRFMHHLDLMRNFRHGELVVHQ